MSPETYAAGVKPGSGDDSAAWRATQQYYWELFAHGAWCAHRQGRSTGRASRNSCCRARRA